MRDSGKKINNTDMEKRHGLMVLAMKESTKRVKRTAMVNSSGLMGQLIKVNLLTIIFMAWEFILGLIRDNIMVFG